MELLNSNFYQLYISEGMKADPELKEFHSLERACMSFVDGTKWRALYHSLAKKLLHSLKLGYVMTTW